MKPTDAARPAAALAMALMLIGAGAGGATATVSSVDTSGSDATSSTSEVQTGTTVYMNNTTGSVSYQVIATNATTDPVTKVVATGTGFTAAENASMTNVSVASEGSHFNATIEKSALEDVEHSIGENVTVEFRAFNNSSQSTADVNTTAYLEFDNSTTLQNIDDADLDEEDIVEITDESTWFGLGDDVSKADIDTDDRDVDGEDTDVIIALSNSSVQDEFDAPASDASSGDKLSTLWSSERTVLILTDDEGKTVPVPVYNEEAPDEVDEDDDSYAVYKDVGGTQSLVVNLGEDDFDDADEVSVHAIGNADRGAFATTYLLAGVGVGFINMSAVLGMVPVVAGRRHRSEPTQVAA